VEEPFPSERAGSSESARAGSAQPASSGGAPQGDSPEASTDLEQTLGEEVDGQLVPLEDRSPWGGAKPSGAVARSERSVPVTLLPAVAAGSFAAGAAVMTYVHRRRSPARPARGRRTSLRRGNGGGAQERLQIVGSRSLLLDIHLLGKSR
jgi:hypothetical protein